MQQQEQQLRYQNQNQQQQQLCQIEEGIGLGKEEQYPSVMLLSHPFSSGNKHLGGNTCNSLSHGGMESQSVVPLSSLSSSSSSLHSTRCHNNKQSQTTNNNRSKHRRRRSYSPHSNNHHYYAYFRTISYLILIVLLVICFLLAVVAVCLDHLRHDVLLGDVVTPWVNLVVDVSDDEQVEALELGRAILQKQQHGGAVTTTNRGGDQVLDMSFLDHEVKALVDGGGEMGGEDFLLEDEPSRNVGNVMVTAQQEQDTAWLRLQQSFEKRDAKIQSQWWNANKVVHVIHTRCLQNQPRLVDYTQARMDQFRTFTLPSLLQQSNDEFLWIVWTDPSLLPETEDQLKALLQPMHNAVLIGFKDRKERTDIRSPWFKETFDQSYMFGGSYKLLMSYHDASHNHIVLDSYIDSDDALATNFVSTLQQQAVQALSSSLELSQSSNTGTISEFSSLSEVSPAKVRFWCPSHVLEWDYFTPTWLLQMETKMQQQQQQQSRSNTRSFHNPLQEEENGALDTLATTTTTTAATDTSQSSSSSSSSSAAAVLVEQRGHFTYKEGYDKCLSSAGTTIGFSANATLEQHFPMFIDVMKQEKDKWHETILPCDDGDWTEANGLGLFTNPHDDATNPHGSSSSGDGTGDHTLLESSSSSSGYNNRHDVITTTSTIAQEAMVLRSKTITGAENKNIIQNNKLPKVPPSLWLRLQSLEERNNHNIPNSHVVVNNNNKNSMMKATGMSISLSMEDAMKMQHEIWEQQITLQRFGIEPESIHNFRMNFTKNLDKVLLDMLTICLPTPHACKTASKKTLQELLATVGLKQQQQQQQAAHSQHNSNNDHQ